MKYRFVKSQLPSIYPVIWQVHEIDTEAAEDSKVNIVHTVSGSFNEVQADAIVDALNYARHGRDVFEALDRAFENGFCFLSDHSKCDGTHECESDVVVIATDLGTYCPEVEGCEVNDIIPIIQMWQLRKRYGIKC